MGTHDALCELQLQDIDLQVGTPSQPSRKPGAARGSPSLEPQMRAPVAIAHPPPRKIPCNHGKVAALRHVENRCWWSRTLTPILGPIAAAERHPAQVDKHLHETPHKDTRVHFRRYFVME